MKRREFIKRAVLLSASRMIWLSPYAWAGRALGAGGTDKRLVVVFLRGAVDGLNVVVPYGDSTYYSGRPSIALKRTGGDNGVLDLDGHFGLHPALKPLMAQWQDRTLAFVHSCGSPDPTRSHFDAQDYMESGTPGRKATADGWMNRLMAQLPGAHAPTEAVNLGPTVPRILNGRLAVANIRSGRAATRPMPLDRPQFEEAFSRLYQGGDALSKAYREGVDTQRKLTAEIVEDMTIADGGAPGPQGFPADANVLAHLIARDSSVRLAFV